MSSVLAQAAPAEVVGSSAEFWVFVVAAVIALATAISVVMLRNAMHSALMLVGNFFVVAVLFAVLEAQFLAVVQIIVYAGAIMVLFLFVLMLLGVSSELTFSGRVRGQRIAAVLAGLALLIVLVGAAAGPFLGADAICPAPETAGDLCAGLSARNADGNVAGVGRLLFTDYMWPFEVTSVLLVIAAIGVIVLGKRHLEEDTSDVGVSTAAALAAPEPNAPRGELVAAGTDGEEDQT